MEQTNPIIPAQETKSMKSAFSRAGLSVAALYGAIAEAQTISIYLITMLVTAWLAFRPDSLSGVLNALSDPGTLGTDLLDSGIIGVLLLVFLLCQAVAWLVGAVLMRQILPKGKPIEKKNLSFGRFLLVALLCFGVWGVGAALGNLSSFFGADTDSLFSVDFLGKALVPYLIYAVIGAPILEELTFRKVLLDGLHDWHEGYAAVLSALLFGLMHGNHMQFFLAFFIGLIFAMVYQRTGRVIYSMLLHAMINLTGTLPEFFNLCGVDISRGWNFAVGALVLGGLVALFVLRRDPLLQSSSCTVPDANRAVYKNLGMRLTRIAGLVLIGAQGVLLIAVGIYNDPSSWVGQLIGLVPLALSFLTVLLLPKFTKRYEAKPAPEGSV